MINDEDEMINDEDEMINDEDEMINDEDEMINDEDEMINDEDEMINDKENIYFEKNISKVKKHITNIYLDELDIEKKLKDFCIEDDEMYITTIVMPHTISFPKLESTYLAMHLHPLIFMSDDIKIESNTEFNKIKKDIVEPDTYNNIAPTFFDVNTIYIESMNMDDFVSIYIELLVEFSIKQKISLKDKTIFINDIYIKILYLLHILLKNNKFNKLFNQHISKKESWIKFINDPYLLLFDTGIQYFKDVKLMKLIIYKHSYMINFNGMSFSLNIDNFENIIHDIVEKQRKISTNIVEIYCSYYLTNMFISMIDYKIKRQKIESNLMISFICVAMFSYTLRHYNNITMKDYFTIYKYFLDPSYDQVFCKLISRFIDLIKILKNTISKNYNKIINHVIT
jgi:hypothetical protein